MTTQPLKNIDLNWDDLHEIYETAVREIGEATYSPNYSGRAMYGRTCPSITCDPGSEMHLGAAIVYAAATYGIGYRDALKLIPESTDGMGRQMVCYNRRIDTTDAPQYEEEDPY